MKKSKMKRDACWKRVWLSKNIALKNMLGQRKNGTNGRFGR
jgi:hypothetical protein